MTRLRRTALAAFLGRFGTALFAVVLALSIYGLCLASASFGDAPLFLLVIPLVLCALAYGLRGGVALGLLGAALASAWWLQEGEPGGASWYASRIATYLLIGVVLGRAVDARQAAVRQLEHHSELSLDLIATASFEGFFTRVNPAFTHTLGYAPEELISRPFLDFVHPDDRESTIRAAAEQTEAGHEVMNFQNRYRAKDGSYRWLEWTSRPDPQTNCLIAVARDVTDRKELEEREHRYQERLEQAVAERTSELEQRTLELEEARQETLQRLALVAEYRDKGTLEHTRRVSDVSALIACELGLPESEAELIRAAAPLHDVGKVGVSDAVLFKAGPLTKAEFAQVKLHSSAGAAILSGSKSDILRAAEEIARDHHEWWDGSGYPAGLAGGQIPIAARIVALADVFDALTHARPYKAAWTVEQAAVEIRRLRGRQFDPQVVDAFIRLNPHRLAGLGSQRLGNGEPGLSAVA